MKNIFATLLLSIVVFTAQSQIKESNGKVYIPKGTWFTGGSISINFINSDAHYGNNGIPENGESERIEFSVSPRLGYAIAKNWTLGMELGYSYGRTKSKNFENEVLVRESRFTGNSFGVNPFVRRYIGLGKKLMFFFQTDLAYSYGESKAEELFDEDSIDNPTFLNSYDYRNVFFVGIKPGLNYFLNEHWALESTVGRAGYEYRKSSNDNSPRNIDSESNRFFIDLSLSNVYFGVSYFF
ncbi:outer membrane beta-barrel protein [Galbibacter sp. BG1]|uniref:outer membrane beta-barrel protein n=1 Tax=Galbibacter sp. BG1 TaxID=1170699 RepID=UPI0015BDC574|nr:outer membrane beta-barrel protein [Galbibacter sp. BG1]QLE00253.1 outer membrane beta-barrel protein [Galbibacter sp. BG1]